jgi:hypothetical protein
MLTKDMKQGCIIVKLTDQNTINSDWERERKVIKLTWLEEIEGTKLLPLLGRTGSMDPDPELNL